MSDPKPASNNGNTLHTFRISIYGLIIVVVVLGLALVVTAISQPTSGDDKPEQVDALARSRDDCVTCHRKDTPGIVDQFAFSAKAAEGVTCRDCHEVAMDYPGATEHEGTYVLSSPTPAICEECHAVEVSQFGQSRHSSPAYAAMQGVTGFNEAQLAAYKNIPEGSFNPDKMRNKLYDLEGEAITRFACQVCHNIGAPHPDGSIGQCQKCHLRHEFSLEQVRKPETCNQCHIGPDHPQWEIYQESPHGIAYMTRGHTWNWDAEPGTLTSKDMPAPTCATCHMSGFGATGTTHDIGDRLTWYLFASVSERRPAWEDNRVRMQNVCRNCHNEKWIEDFYTDADKCVEAVNELVRESNDVMAPVKAANILTAQAFDEPIEFIYFDLWHHWGRTTKFGAWMQGPDYVQWHGIYELLRDMAELKEIAAEKLEEHNISVPTTISGSQGE